ncbi:NAD(P)H-binding protein [Chryseobacterium sp. PBS4-4]|uniref:NAD(P)H-binding protein n=1 Tax=Chryseobacterium edaphi TaxID=2976532 RepID=A0ABT2W8B0_9FLAO|nr:NAD(P)H-binding protein [Chryseobacterium edaphi]MCU7618209.1 NAD(P)H-binding protein [Chryseobacterium edaphi]
MKIIITGSLGNVAKQLAQQLISEGHEIIVISSNESKKSEIESLGAKAAIGSVTDVEFLKETFSGADSVFLMTPPMIDATNIIEKTINVGKNYAEAILETGVKRLVMLSSVGADSPVENGPIASLHHIEKIYSDLENVSSTFLRAGNFYINFFNDIPLIKNAGIIGANYSADVKVPLVHPKDIAKAAAEELVETSSDQKIRYVVSDNRPAGDFAKVFGAAIGKPDLQWIEFTDEQTFEGISKAGLPEEMAKLYEEMGRGIRNGIVQEDFIKYGSPIEGETELEDFAKEFADQFNS